MKNAESMLKKSYKIFGESITSGVLKLSFFGHFCAGEDPESIRPTIKRLEVSGVGSILDYAAEADVEDQPSSNASGGPPQKEQQLVQSRTYDYTTEQMCDKHLAIFESCIRAVKSVSPSGFAAIKCTALGDPRLLERMSTAIVELHNLFEKFDVDKTGRITKDQFMSAYNQFFTDGADARDKFEHFDIEKDGFVDYIDWTNSLVIEDLHTLTSKCRQSAALAKATLTPEEREMVKRMRGRLDKLASLAQELGVRVMIDAEHSYFQPAIDNMTVDLQKKYNKTYPAVFGTYQMYLRDSKKRLFLDIDRARKGNYMFAAKLVRGAYMVLERARSASLGLPDIIFPELQGTHDNYNSGVDDILHRIAAGEKIELMLASHNQESVERAVSTMARLGIPPNKGVYFGQLLGMSDHLTFALGRSGYQAYKYVPYGRVHEVMPYLVRRAQENSGLLGGASQDLGLIAAEIRRRLGAK